VAKVIWRRPHRIPLSLRRGRSGPMRYNVPWFLKSLHRSHSALTFDLFRTTKPRDRQTDRLLKCVKFKPTVKHFRFDIWLDDSNLLTERLWGWGLPITTYSGVCSLMYCDCMQDATTINSAARSLTSFITPLYNREQRVLTTCQQSWQDATSLGLHTEDTAN